MEKGEGYVKWFSELSNKDVPIAGGKGASLAEMFNSKFPIPPGFVISAQAYSYFIKETKLDVRISAILNNLDVENTTSLNNASTKIREIVEAEKLPRDLEEEIVESYGMLGDSVPGMDPLKVLKSSEDAIVAVRSSATTEDLADASFAGQQDTFLNVKGAKSLIEYAKKCMSSLFTARAIYYRTKKGFDHSKSYLAVVVQKMINSEKSGVMFSQNPMSGDKSIVIEAVWGLGEGIVSGQIKPDHYVIHKDLEHFKLLEAQINVKKIAIIKKSSGKNETIKLDDEKAEARVLDNYELKRLAQYGRELEEHYKKPQDIEFAIDKSGIYIVQSRPITTVFKESKGDISGEVLLSGLGASPGAGSGPVKIVHEMSDLEKVKSGDVLVTEMTNPDMVVSMQRAAAIITDEGGLTSHASIVSREMGIPCVVGTGEATKKLKDGDIVTVDGSAGKVYKGKGETKTIEIEPIVPTNTIIKVIVDIPSFAERAARSGSKHVGLIRLEGIIAEGGKHPVHFVKSNKIKDYVELIHKGIRKIAQHFDGMWIRTSDIRSDEYNHLEGAPQHVESNPMLGDHGVRFSLKHPDIMRAELIGIKEVADDYPDKEFGIMVPQVISVEEVRKTKEIAKEVGIPSNIKIGIMVETPAAVQLINEMCEEGIDFISFGTNDLTQFTLAIDRNNEDVQHLFNEMHPAILNSLKYVIRKCKKYGVTTSICGQAGSKPEMASFLVQEGIDSISVNADAARKVSMIVSEIEKSKGIKPVDRTKSEDRGEYQPGNKHDKKRDMPYLNDSIPINSKMF